MMKLVLVTLAVLSGVALSASLGQLPQEIKDEDHELGIIDGNTVGISKHPYIVSFTIDGTLRGSGVVLNENWVLTSAVNGLLAGNATIRAGSRKWRSGGQSTRVLNAIVHPNYTDSYTNDVAVLKLATPLKLGHKVEAIELGTKLPVAGTVGKVAGWGQTTVSVVMSSDRLKEAKNTILDAATCSQTFGSEYDVTVFCTSIEDAGPRVYDIGDPLVIDNKLYGLYAGGNDNSTLPRLYANIPELAHWIKSTIKS